MAPICPNCITGHRLSGDSTGEMVRVSPNVVDAYYASKHSRQEEGATGKKAVVFLTDIFGLPLGNPKIMADTINERLGVDVWVPDMFDGKPWLLLWVLIRAESSMVGRYPVSSESLGPLIRDTPDAPQHGFLTKLKMVFTLLSVLPSFLASRPSVVSQRSEAVSDLVANCSDPS